MSVTSTSKDITSEIVNHLRLDTQIPQDKLRQEALDFFSSAGLPSQKNEEFRFTPLTRELEKNFNKSDYYALALPESVPFGMPDIDTYTLAFIDGMFKRELSSLPENLQIVLMPLAEALEKQPLAQAHFTKITDYKNNAFTAWNTAGWKDGVFIHIPDNVVFEKPILFHYINSGEHSATHISRNLIVCGKSSELTIIEKFDTRAGNFYFQNLLNEVVVNENAGFNLYSIQNDIGHRYQYTHTEIFQKNSSRVNTFTFTLNGKLIRNNLHLILDGEGIESHMYGLYLLSGDTLADNHTVADHRKPNSFSNEMYKGIMEGNSKGVFNGKIFVRPQAQKTNAFQANRNILIGDKSTVNTKPQLEIWADDVKCSHGCTSGQLDEEAVFYLRSRGISKETAQAMMLYAFAGEVLENVKHPQIKEYLDTAISERLHKNF
jgi:Fe-S cluster assembly protein SufD